MTDLNPAEKYKEQVAIYDGELQALKRKRSIIGWLRLLLVLGIVLFIYYLFFNQSALVWITVFASIATFLYLVSADTDNNNKINQLEKLLQINQEELAILSGNFYNREDGILYLPQEHPYAGDIDIFGTASIYQYINRCTSEQSKELLAPSLLNPSDKQTISNRQEAAKALSNQLEWRQQFQVSGLLNPITEETERKMMQWITMNDPFKQSHWQYIPAVFTAITLGCTAAFFLDLIPTSIYTMLVFVFFLYAKLTSGKVQLAYTALSKVEDEVNTIEQQIRQVENLNISSALIKDYKQKLIQGKGGSASIKELKQIVNRFNFRLNVFVFLFLNTFLLWDVRQMISLNKWKEKCSSSVVDWFTILSNIELLNTLATLTFNHPHWIFPQVSNEHFTLKGEDLGHPLIAENKRVVSSFTTKGTAKVSIITGSNMAGKSTFLRSIGVNLILAQAGAPVCAKSFTFSPVELYSSMRIADNLAENTSTFYAELKKLKTIIEQVKQHKKVFILLDEILRGTNSLDRHTGSEALIKQLIKEDAVAVIATHDVELAALENDYNQSITNYHFDVQVEGEGLYFDYKLKQGVCKGLNASILMKKIGIEI